MSEFNCCTAATTTLLWAGGKNIYYGILYDEYIYIYVITILYYEYPTPFTIVITKTNKYPHKPPCHCGDPIQSIVFTPRNHDPLHPDVIAVGQMRKQNSERAAMIQC